MKILFVGDVVGAPGRRALHEALTGVIDRHRVDFTIVNIENAAGGFGLTVELFEDLSRMPIDVFSSGNHIWDKREIYDTLNSSDRLLRPANYPPGNPGRGATVQTTAAGIPVDTREPDAVVSEDPDEAVVHRGRLVRRDQPAADPGLIRHDDERPRPLRTPGHRLADRLRDDVRLDREKADLRGLFRPAPGQAGGGARARAGRRADRRAAGPAAAGTACLIWLQISD